MTESPTWYIFLFVFRTSIVAALNWILCSVPLLHTHTHIHAQTIYLRIKSVLASKFTIFVIWQATHMTWGFILVKTPGSATDEMTVTQVWGIVVGRWKEFDISCLWTHSFLYLFYAVTWRTEASVGPWLLTRYPENEMEWLSSQNQGRFDSTNQMNRILQFNKRWLQTQQLLFSK